MLSKPWKNVFLIMFNCNHPRFNTSSLQSMFEQVDAVIQHLVRVPDVQQEEDSGSDDTDSDEDVGQEEADSNDEDEDENDIAELSDNEDEVEDTYNKDSEHNEVDEEIKAMDTALVDITEELMNTSFFLVKTGAVPLISLRSEAAASVDYSKLLLAVNKSVEH